MEKPALCAGCPAFDTSCVSRGIWDPEARLTFIGESPTPDSVRANAEIGGQPFQGQNGQLLRRIVSKYSAAMSSLFPNGIKYNMAYASGSLGKPTVHTVTKCSELWKSQWATHYSQQQGIHVIVPLGANATKSAGITTKKILDVRGRTETRNYGTKQVVIVPTLGMAHVYAKPGLVEVVQQDILRAIRLAYLDKYTPAKPIEELAKGYRFPKSIDEIRALCDEIIAYNDPEKPRSPDDWPIAVDTETNTLKPFRKDAKLLMISFAWDDGKAAAILLHHLDNKWYDPDEAWEEVKRVLQCRKPKIFHNCKFDLQFIEKVLDTPVTNVAWDSMAGEHWLSEDQKGVYGLKAMAPLYAPEYEGYEETLHEALRQGEDFAPTEDDVVEEAKGLAVEEGVVQDGNWFEGGFILEPTKAPEIVIDNSRWKEDPEWPGGVNESQKESYRKLRNRWFELDAQHMGRERGAVVRSWKALAKKIGVPVPDPTPEDSVQKKEGFEVIAVDTLLPYAAADADVTRLILKKQLRKLHRSQLDYTQAHQVMESIYVPASRALGSLEYRGVRVDLAKAQEYDSSLTVLLDDITNKIYDLACRHFKINAQGQLNSVLSDFGFGTVKTTESGEASTAKDVIVTHQKNLVVELSTLTDPDLRDKATRKLDFVEALLLYRAAFKMKTSFLKNLREYAALDGHIHTTFHLTGTSTGRLSSSRLNLQNLPLYMCHVTRPNPDDPENPFVVHEGFNVKSLLIPETDDEVFWNLDIKAAEIRVCAYYSGDAGLIEALNNGLDVHTYFLTKIKHPEMTDAQLLDQYKIYHAAIKGGDAELTKFRNAVKRVVFGTLYGAGPRKIAAQIGDNYPIESAQAIINALFTAFPGIKRYVQTTKQLVRDEGKVSTVFGRYRRFAIAGVSREMTSRAEREAVNFRIQSTSSDLVVSQLCEINDHLHELDAVMRLTVHDSMAGTVKKSRVGEMKAFFDYWLVGRVKERFPWLPVPFEYDLEIGPSYGDKEKWSDWVKTQAVGV